MAHDLMTLCEQRKPFLVNRKSEWRWKEVRVSDAIGASAGSIRCKYCHGAVRIHQQQVEHGPQDHVEHLSRQDSEFCQGGFHFKGEHRLSTRPVQ
jgi:hypothetical protein